MHRHAYPCPLELTLVEEAQTGRQKGDDCGCPMLRPGKLGRSARLVVIFEKTRKLVLVIEASHEGAREPAAPRPP